MALQIVSCPIPSSTKRLVCGIFGGPQRAANATTMVNSQTDWLSETRTAAIPAWVGPGNATFTGTLGETTVFERYPEVTETDYGRAKRAWRAKQIEWRTDLLLQDDAVRISGFKKLDSAWAATYYVDQDDELTEAQKTTIHVEAEKGAVGVETVQQFIPLADQYQTPPVNAELWVDRTGTRTGLAGMHNWGTLPGRKFYQTY